MRVDALDLGVRLEEILHDADGLALIGAEGLLGDELDLRVVLEDVLEGFGPGDLGVGAEDLPKLDDGALATDRLHEKLGRDLSAVVGICAGVADPLGLAGLVLDAAVVEDYWDGGVIEEPDTADTGLLLHGDHDDGVDALGDEGLTLGDLLGRVLLAVVEGEGDLHAALLLLGFGLVLDAGDHVLPVGMAPGHGDADGEVLLGRGLGVGDDLAGLRGRRASD